MNKTSFDDMQKKIKAAAKKAGIKIVHLGKYDRSVIFSGFDLEVEDAVSEDDFRSLAENIVDETGWTISSYNMREVVFKRGEWISTKSCQIMRNSSAELNSALDAFLAKG